MGILTWVIVAVVVLAIIGLGVGTFFSGVWRGAEEVVDNPTIRNSTEPVREFVNETVKSGIGDGTGKDKAESSSIELTTNKSTYRQGEPVTFTIKNNAGEALEFPNSVFGLEIMNTETDEQVPIFSAQVITSIEPGESESITLPLEGGDGQPAKAGNYLAKVHTTPKEGVSAAQTSYVITQE